MLVIIIDLAVQTTIAYSLQTAQQSISSSGTIIYNESLTKANSSPSTVRPLHVEGNQIKNDYGQIILLRGWNLASGTETVTFKLPSWEFYDQTAVNNIFSALRNYGANVVRYHLVATSWIDNVDCNTTQGVKTYRQCLDDLLTRAAEYNIYVILCPAGIHQYNIGDSCQMGFDPYTSTKDRGVITNQNQFTDFVAQIVTVLGSHDNLIIEPWNEPLWGYTGDSICIIWQSIYNEVISKIRATETNNGYNHHLICCQLGASLHLWSINDPSSNFNWLTSYPLTDPTNNLIYSSHCYRSWGSVGGTDNSYQDAPTDYSTIKNIYINEGVKEAAEAKPIIIGEIGVLDNSNEYDWLDNTLTIFNEWNIGYLGWTWRDDGGVYAEIIPGSKSTTGGTVNRYGQLIVDNIAGK